jgi:hypothetical protein
MSKPTSVVVLMRGERRVEIGFEMWSGLLLFLSKRRWRSSIPAHSLLAKEVNISQDDASNLAVAGQVALDEAVHDPLTVYPLPFDMGKLAEIVCFCEEGAFRICR